MGKAAARTGDATAHGGIITGGYADVLIDGMPAARVGDMHTCPMMGPESTPHEGGPILTGSNSVLIGDMYAARVGDLATCNGPPDAIVVGCMTVLIGD